MASTFDGIAAIEANDNSRDSKRTSESLGIGVTVSVSLSMVWPLMLRDASLHAEISERV